LISLDLQAVSGFRGPRVKKLLLLSIFRTSAPASAQPSQEVQLIYPHFLFS
jgi:hypothetical protein